MANEKDINLNENLLNEDELVNVSGGKMVNENLVFKKAETQTKATNALYSGGSKKSSNLLYKDDDRTKTPPTINLDGAKLC